MRDTPHHETASTTTRNIRKNIFTLISIAFERGFLLFSQRYIATLKWSLFNPRKILMLFGIALFIACAFVPFVGRDFFPTIDADELRLHVSAPTGTRIG